MRITSIDIWTVVVPIIPGRVHSQEWVSETGWDQVPKQIVRLNTETELKGIGETARGVDVETVAKGASLLIGRDLETIALRNIFRGRVDGSEDMVREADGDSSYDAFEMAVLDLVGHMRNLPAHALLGGAVRERVRADYWMGHQTPEDGKRTLERALDAGFKGVKIKCRAEEPMVERLQAMLDVAGKDFKVTVDPNERFYTAEKTIELAEQLAPLGNVEVFEDPIPKNDLEGYAKIHESIDLPVAMHLGEDTKILQAMKADLIDCFNLNGGPVVFMHNASVAAAGGFRCWHGSGNDLGIMDTSYIHCAALAPNCTMASDFVGSWTREDDLILEPILFEDGFVSVPMAPGLGCDLDLDAVGRYSQAHQQVTE